MLIQLRYEGQGDYDPRDMGWIVRKHPDRVYPPSGKGEIKVYFGNFGKMPGGGPCGSLVFEFMPPLFGSVGGEGYVTPGNHQLTAQGVTAFARAFSTAMHDDPPEGYADAPVAWSVEVSAFLGRVERASRWFNPLGWFCAARQDRLTLYTADMGRGTERRPTRQALRELYCVLLALAGDAELTEEGRTKFAREAGDFLADHPHLDEIVSAVASRKSEREGLAEVLRAAGAGEGAEDVEADPEEAAPAASPEVGETGDGKSLAVARREWILAKLAAHVPEGGRVLEVGCGTGWIPQKFAAARPDVYYLATDPSLVAVEGAKRYNRKVKNVRIHQGALGWDRLGLAPGVDLAPFDAIVASEVLEHMPMEAANEALGALMGLLKEGGVVIATLPNGRYNTLWGMLPNERRHAEHWWEAGVGGSRLFGGEDIGCDAHPVHPILGGPSIGVLFEREDSSPWSCRQRPNLYGTTPPALSERPFFVPGASRALAFEAMSRFLHPACVYLPPTMAPAGTSQREGYLEHPEDALAYYAARGVPRVAVQRKHMGSRAIVAISRFERDGYEGIWTRYGRQFFADRAVERELLERLRSACWRAGFFDGDRRAALFDTELMPWSAKAGGLIDRQFVPAGRAAVAALYDIAAARLCARDRLAASGFADAAAQLDADGVHTSYEEARLYQTALARYVEPPETPPRLHIFGILATGYQIEGMKPWTAPISETMPILDKIGSFDKRIRSTVTICADTSSPEDAAAVAAAWTEYTEGPEGGEGFVIKPDAPRPGTQPAVKARGREYLRIVYGPHYTAHLDKLRQRKLESKRFLALWQDARGQAMLQALAQRRPQTDLAAEMFWLLASSYRRTDPRL